MPPEAFKIRAGEHVVGCRIRRAVILHLDKQIQAIPGDDMEVRWAQLGVEHVDVTSVFFLDQLAVAEGGSDVREHRVNP
jgi:hypothetical protein